MTEVKRNTFIITGIGIIGIILTIYFFKESDKTLPNYATVIGTICSLIGLAIAYVNIVALKKASIQMTDEIKNALQNINVTINISPGLRWALTILTFLLNEPCIGSFHLINFFFIMLG